MPLPVTETDGIRRFDDVNIQRAVERALAAMPDGKRFAIVAHADLSGGVSLSAVTKLGGDWSVAVSAFKPYSGPIVAEAEVVWSPF